MIFVEWTRVGSLTLPRAGVAFEDLWEKKQHNSEWIFSNFSNLAGTNLKTEHITWYNLTLYNGKSLHKNKIQKLEIYTENLSKTSKQASINQTLLIEKNCDLIQMTA